MKYKEVNNYIDKLLIQYPICEAKNNFLKTVNFDLESIKQHFFQDLSNLTFREEAIVSKLSIEVEQLNLKYNPFSEYKISSSQKIYNIF